MSRLWSRSGSWVWYVSCLVWGLVWVVGLPSQARAQAILYQGEVRGGVATDATGVSPAAYDTKFYRGPDLELRVPTGATLQSAWLFVYGGPSGLYVSSSTDTVDQIKLAGKTLREGGAVQLKEVRNSDGRKLVRVYDVSRWLTGSFPTSTNFLKLSVEEQGRADTSDKSSISIQGEQLVVVYGHTASPLRHVVVGFGYDTPPISWHFKGLPTGAEKLEQVGLLSNTLIFNNACDQIGRLELSGLTSPSSESPLLLTSTAGGRDDGVYASNPTCSPKGEDTNSQITAGSFGATSDLLTGVDGDSLPSEPAGERSDSRLSDELFRIPYDAGGLLNLDYSASDITSTDYEPKTGYLAASILVLDYKDSDRDGILDWQDLCPLVYDPTQGDLDEDGLGDYCDPCTDQDNDGSATPLYADYGTCLTDCNDLDPTVNPFTQEVPYNGIDEDCILGDLVDVDNDGAAAAQVGGPDCDDADPTRTPGKAERCDGIDQDCDHLIDEDFDLDGDGYSDFARCPVGSSPTQGTDCNDGSANSYPDAEESCDGEDNDCDGQEDESLTGCPTADLDRDGFTPLRGDCDDNDPSLNPAASEDCDGIDNNCNGAIDESFDADRDGFASALTCPLFGDDCDDGNALVQPTAQERCDGQDNNCDGRSDEGLDASCPSTDSDGDGYRPLDGDCDDLTFEVNPGALESCDGLDNDCDSRVDEDFDVDGDGHLDAGLCGARGDDCDDLRPFVQPGAQEVCDDLDNNCDGSIDEGFDKDQDGYRDMVACPGIGTDCYDRNRGIHPGAEETCNGIDNDCDGIVGADEVDNDGDGWLVCAGDCADDNIAIAPGVDEICDGLDDNCDGRVDEGYDDDLDGYTDPVRCPSSGTDCDDTDPSRSPAASERCDGRDDNCDGRIDEPFDVDQDGHTDQATCPTGDDCDDAHAEVAPDQLESCDALDNDCNGRIDEGLEDCPTTDADGDGVSPDGGDCDDSNPAISPNASELCDSIDNNCNLSVDEGFDADSDGHYSARDCAYGDDCNDQLATVYPGAEEICDNLDNDCDDERDEDLGQLCTFLDLDGDGYSPRQGDCNDADAAVYPGASEVCDGFDQNCNGRTDEGFDRDADGQLDVALCAVGTDCDDLSPTIYLGAEEECNGVDDNCDQVIDDGLPDDCLVRDFDQDGFRIVDGDCNDEDPQTYPDAPEVCDEIDQNCNGTADEPFDLDGDGYTDASICLSGTDCDDTNPDIHPGAIEYCDGIDNDCDYAIDELFDLFCRSPQEQDLDHDGFTRLQGDCADFNPRVYPGALEVCNGADDDCDRRVDEDQDQDLDGARNVLTCPNDDWPDCDDLNPFVSPRLPEVCDDGLDNNCDGIVDPEGACEAVTPEPTPTLLPEGFSGGGAFCSVHPLDPGNTRPGLKTLALVAFALGMLQRRRTGSRAGMN